MKYAPYTITELKPNQVFVFGSNLAGHHYGGAALTAYEEFGAVWGDGCGFTGQSYAFPTLDREFKKLKESELRVCFAILINACLANPHKEFLMTKVGIGIAGFRPITILSAFNSVLLQYGLGNPPNLLWPEDWHDTLFRS